MKKLYKALVVGLAIFGSMTGLAIETNKRLPEKPLAIREYENMRYQDRIREKKLQLIKTNPELSRRIHTKVMNVMQTTLSVAGHLIGVGLLAYMAWNLGL